MNSLVVYSNQSGNTDRLAREAGLLCSGSIVINQYCQTSDPDIYAGGDCVINHYSTQVAGLSTAGKGYLDVAAATIPLGGSLDQLADVDFSYAPPYSPPIEPLATCAHLLTNKLDGLANGVSPLEAKKRIEAGEAVLLDTRTPAEIEEMRLPYDVVHIPLGALRQRMDELPRDRDILAFCKVSMRGYEAQRMLNAAGYERVGFIEGGIVGWPFEVQFG